MTGLYAFQDVIGGRNLAPVNSNKWPLFLADDQNRIGTRRSANTSSIDWHCIAGDNNGDFLPVWGSGTEGFTLVLWLEQVTSASGGGTLLTYGVATRTSTSLWHWRLMLSSSNQPQFFVANTAGGNYLFSQPSTALAVADTRWQQLAVLVETGATRIARIAIDGTILSHTFGGTGTPKEQTYEAYMLNVGSDPFGQSPMLNWSISEIRFYKSVLTESNLMYLRENH